MAKNSFLPPEGSCFVKKWLAVKVKNFLAIIYLYKYVDRCDRGYRESDILIIIFSLLQMQEEDKDNPNSPHLSSSFDLAML